MCFTKRTWRKTREGHFFLAGTALGLAQAVLGPSVPHKTVMTASLNRECLCSCRMKPGSPSPFPGHRFSVLSFLYR